MPGKPVAVVVGSGPSGGMVARVLALSADYQVIVLEKGRSFFTGLGGPADQVGNVFSNDEVGWELRNAPINQDPLVEPRSFRTDPSAGARTFVGNVQNLPTTVGGGAVHFDAKARRFREVDFITNSLMGGTPDRPAVPGTTYTDWPVHYRHLEPFYAVSEEIVGIQGPAHRSGTAINNPNPYESPRSTPFPMPPGVSQLNSLLLADAGKRLGHTPAPVPTAVNSRPYRGRSACNDCGQCLAYGCTINAKGSGVWPLNDALRTGRVSLVTEANVVAVEYGKGSGGRYHATGVTYIDGNGNTKTQAADLVVLANSPIEATRLTIQSGIAKAPNDSSLSTLVTSPTEPSGLLGRNLMFHLQTIAIAIMNENVHSWRGRASTQCIDTFAGPGPSAKDFNPAIPRGGILELGGNYDPVSEAAAPAGFVYGVDQKEYMDLGPFTKRIASLSLQGEDMPQLTNYVDLDPQIVDVFGQPVPRVTYKNHQYELDASAYYAPKMLEILQAVGGPGSSYPDIRPIFTGVINTVYPAVLPGQLDSGLQPVTSATPFTDVPATAHIMGTHRMALDPEHGPCDPYGRYWAFDNLYHTGGGLFCTAPGYNVTLTMWALSYWAGAAIAGGVGQQSSYSSKDIDAGYDQLVKVLKRLDPKTMIARTLK
ncbi:MAG: GMC oxidoreductase [Acidimicrobiales bacterium]